MVNGRNGLLGLPALSHVALQLSHEDEVVGILLRNLEVETVLALTEMKRIALIIHLVQV